MTIVEALVHFLRSNAGIAALVVDRIHPEVLPQNPAYPAIVFHLIGTDPDHTNDGPSGYTQKLLQFDLVARSVAEVEAMSRVLRLAISGYKGLMGPVPETDSDPDQIEVFACFRIGERSDYDDDFKLHFRIADYELHFDEEH